MFRGGLDDTTLHQCLSTKIVSNVNDYETKAEFTSLSTTEPVNVLQKYPRHALELVPLGLICSAWIVQTEECLRTSNHRRLRFG